MLKMSLILLVVVLQLLVPLASWAAGGAEACSTVVSRLAKGQTLSEADYVKLGFKFEKNANYHKAIVLPMDDAQWAAARKSVKADMDKTAGDFKFMGEGDKHPGLEKPYLRVAETGEGVTSQGMRYIPGKDGRLFQLKIIEKVERGASGNVNHYVSVQVSEIAEGGAKPVKFAYSDSPHVSDTGTFWFHSHDAKTGDVLGELPARGFDHSVVPNIMTWAKDWVQKLPGH